MAKITGKIWFSPLSYWLLQHIHTKDKQKTFLGESVRLERHLYVSWCFGHILSFYRPKKHINQTQLAKWGFWSIIKWKFITGKCAEFNPESYSTLIRPIWTIKGLKHTHTRPTHTPKLTSKLQRGKAICAGKVFVVQILFGSVPTQPTTIGFILFSLRGFGFFFFFF